MLEIENCWVYDMEVLPNITTLVAREAYTKNYEKFVLSEDQNDISRLMTFLHTNPVFVGYNSLDFDGQVTEFIVRTHRQNGTVTYEDVYNFVLTLPLNDKTKDRFDLPYSEWEMEHRHIDLFKLNHYDNKGVSLKWLEFTMRSRKLKDLPVDPHKPVSKSMVPSLLSYNKDDVDETHNFFLKCERGVSIRIDMARKYRLYRIMNMSDSSMGSYVVEDELVNKYGYDKRKLKKGTHLDTIYGKDCLVDYIQFDSPAFQEIHKELYNRVYTNVKEEGVEGERYKRKTLFQDMIFVFGSGGIHACWKAGEFESNEEETILSIDVASYYPNLSIKNNFYPQHIGPQFCDIYEGLYNLRKTFPKGTAENYAYKIALNSVYGKSNSVYSLFFDLSYLLKITLNGQFLLCMLAEKLSEYGKLLLVNTDGLEIKIPRKHMDDVIKACQEWEKLTKLELEYDEYSKLIIRDVNNYIAVKDKGSVKRKGMFEVYEDITEDGGKPHSYHKSPNATIIPQALFEYYVNDVPIEETVNKCNNIHEFCYGIKGRKAFEYWLITAGEGGVIENIDTRNDRVLRYYVTKEGANMYKFWKDDRKNRLQAVNKGQLIKLAMTIPAEGKIEEIKKGELNVRYNVDRDYYISKAYEIVDLVAREERDHAWTRYHKDLAKEDKDIS